ncbi:hypothetical protein M91_04970 [Bos mutus]|uniref:Uncharacterized protein n=1 Tax=Bos mutus TaxID=72004 RepID=L8IN80_9CETA|nr:hypothetical protein M91_04970 [Bos mutus]
MKASGMLREYTVVGLCLPTPKCCTPPLYCMRIFAPNHVVAKSHFWYFVSQLKKMKKSSGEIVYCGQVFEKSPLRVKNFSIWLRQDSHSGTHMYRGLKLGVKEPQGDQKDSEAGGGALMSISICQETTVFSTILRASDGLSPGILRMPKDYYDFPLTESYITCLRHTRVVGGGAPNTGSRRETGRRGGDSFFGMKKTESRKMLEPQVRELFPREHGTPRSCQVPGDKEEPQLSSQGAARTEAKQSPHQPENPADTPHVPGCAGVSAEQRATEKKVEPSGQSEHRKWRGTDLSLRQKETRRPSREGNLSGQTIKLLL